MRSQALILGLIALLLSNVSSATTATTKATTSTISKIGKLARPEKAWIFHGEKKTTYRLVDFVSPDPKWTGKNPLQVRLSAQLTACPPASDSENHAASGAAVSIVLEGHPPSAPGVRTA